MTDNNIAIEFNHVSKVYKLNRKGQKNQLFYALKDVSFTVSKGQVVGILGTNGSGKSTLAMLLSGIAAPNEGTITVNGEQALVALTTGLNPQLSGLENIEYKGALLGLSKKQIKEITEGVIEFAELGDFLYQPMKKYSSGMRARLGFSISLCLDPDIFIIDEALSVGDNVFAQKCMKKMDELKEMGKTIVFISHSLPQVRGFCDSAIWIEGGMLMGQGECEELCDQYAEYVKEYNAMTPQEKQKARDKKFKARTAVAKRQNFFERYFK